MAPPTSATATAAAALPTPSTPHQTAPHLAVFFRAVKLPVMPEVAHALIRSLQDRDISAAQVGALVAQDPVLTAKVLRAANGVAMGLQREVESLTSAISLLGLTQVRLLALAACMNVSFPVAPGLNRAHFWRNCMACAGYAQWLAEQALAAQPGLREHLDPQQAWLAGMMLRLGELLIVQSQPQALAQIERLPNVPGSRWASERQALGFTEVDVTAELAQRWRFPDGMVGALQVTATPLAWPASTPAHALLNPLGGVLHLASHLADLNSASLQAADAPVLAPETLDLLPPEVLTALGLSVQTLRAQPPARECFVDLSVL
ncbi:histidine kinase [Hylemonella gracilis str. Niagara R]|uniref:Histidine kinase n=1 Tax=Hylemonella gracilis str. Niagara R TaxID=1458275 RepID=A0A016XI61_9BURK|nr:HDOD domain-containing protein [Hylemonella gracilis]EYC51516.1 histidine kinase [Hylemonella gracilis str. Niagara R]